MPTYLAIPGAPDTREVGLMHRNLSKAYKYASAATSPNPESGSQPFTLSAGMPIYVQDAINRWLKESGFDPSPYVGDEQYEVHGVLVSLPDIKRPGLAPPPPAPEPNLLSIPPEMRNRIYREVLLEPGGEIDIQPWTYLPQYSPLLAVCRQIRHEALGIYFRENVFHFTIHEFDATKLVRWCRMSQSHYEANFRITLEDSYSWPGLMQWLRAYFEGDTIGVGHMDDGNSKDAAVAAFETAQTLWEEGLDWRHAERILQSLRRTLGFAHFDW